MSKKQRMLMILAGSVVVGFVLYQRLKKGTTPTDALDTSAFVSGDLLSAGELLAV